MRVKGEGVRLYDKWRTIQHVAKKQNGLMYGQNCAVCNIVPLGSTECFTIESEETLCLKSVELCEWLFRGTCRGWTATTLTSLIFVQLRGHQYKTTTTTVKIRMITELIKYLIIIYHTQCNQLGLINSHRMVEAFLTHSGPYGVYLLDTTMGLVSMGALQNNNGMLMF